MRPKHATSAVEPIVEWGRESS